MTTATITHRNLLSQRAYTGKYNLKLLDSAGYTKPLWLTFHQIKKCGRKLKQ
ncbi:MAG: DUF1738 domain-containing protein [Candidatus Peribacteria bacterium]|nr:MAG: DUF1738 domain-containing protein [Candidatus Peribacteria bacterium]